MKKYLILIMMFVIFFILPVDKNLNDMIKSEIDLVEKVIYDENYNSYYLITESWAIELNGRKNVNFKEEELLKLKSYYEGKKIKINYNNYDSIVSYVTIIENS